MEAPKETVPMARAYIYAGDWVGDCQRPIGEKYGCGNTEFLFRPTRPNGPRDRKLDFFICSNCGWQAVITWPDNEHELLAALMRRPVPQTRNWYPTDHPVAIAFRIPHGQSVQELLEEQQEHEGV